MWVPVLAFAFLQLFCGPLAAAFFLPQQKRGRFSTFSFRIATSKGLEDVNIFDNVVDCKVLKTLDDEVKTSGLGHTLLERKAFSPRTVTERIIDSILLELGDDSPIVEYWWRDEWMNLEAHRDVDELLARKDQILRTPNNGHVLYISVGSEVAGPTVILRDADADPTKNPDGRFDKITLAPAVSGRLLRFDGNLMHAVPRPPLAYLDPEDGGSNLELWVRRKPVRDDDPEKTVFRRSVLLFNTWNDAPVDVQREPQVPAFSSQEESSSDTALACNTFGQWEPQYEQNTEASNDTENSHQIHLKIGLLGDAQRRGRDSRYLHLMAPVGIKAAFLRHGGPPASFPIQSME
jgi:hypothetical protein